MFSEEIMTCLEQKVILMTQILNITKQIEVRCNEPEVNLEHLLDLRGSLMQRAEKCDNLIFSLTDQLPPEQEDRVKSILNLTAKDLSENEQKASKLVGDANSLYQQAAALDQSANEAMQRQYDETKSKLRELRKNGKGSNLFLDNH